jgi:hypothetical protein
VAAGFGSQLAHRLWLPAAELQDSVLENRREIEEEDARLAIEGPDEAVEEAAAETTNKDAPPAIDEAALVPLEAALEPFHGTTASSTMTSSVTDTGVGTRPLSMSRLLLPTLRGCSPAPHNPEPDVPAYDWAILRGYRLLRTMSVYMTRYNNSNCDRRELRLIHACRSFNPSAHHSSHRADA